MGSSVHPYCSLLCCRVPTTSLKSRLVFSFAMCGIHLNSCCSGCPILCQPQNEVWAVWGLGASLYTHHVYLLYTHTRAHTHMHTQINRMSLWFMVAEGEWRSSVFFGGFSFFHLWYCALKLSVSDWLHHSQTTCCAPVCCKYKLL